MRIQFLNKTTTRIVHPDEFATFVAAFGLQCKEDFCPRHDMSLPAIMVGGKEDAIAFKIQLLDSSDQADALGYHAKDAFGKPIGYIFVETSEKDGEDWRVTGSHEGLELMLDRYCSTWVQAGDTKMRAYEACDAVEADTYTKNVGGDSVPVSNFLLPAYFSDTKIVGEPTDFLNKLKGAPAPAMTPGGYDIIIDVKGDASQEFAKVKAVLGSMKVGRRARKEGRFSRMTRRLAQAAQILGAK